MIDAQEVAYRAGRQACADGKTRAANPHHPEDPGHAIWLRGWQDEYQTLPETLRRVRDAKEAA